MREDIKTFLQEYGFKDCGMLVDWSHEFNNSAYCYNTKMLVAGAHSTDYANLYYVSETTLEGLCYSSSLLEYLLTDFNNNGIEMIIKKIGKYMGIKVELYKEAYVPLVVMRCNENTFNPNVMARKIGDMLKVIGALDYLLQQRLDYLRKK